MLLQNSEHERGYIAFDQLSNERGLKGARHRRGLPAAAAARYQLGAPLTFILIPVTLSTGPVMNKSLSSRPAKVLLVAAVPVGILRMLFPLGSKAITPSPLLI